MKKADPEIYLRLVSKTMIICPFSKSKFNLVAPASPVHRAKYSTTGTERLTRLGHSNVLQLPVYMYRNACVPHITLQSMYNVCKLCFKMNDI